MGNYKKNKEDGKVENEENKYKARQTLPLITYATSI